MANTKISALTSATTPLAGTEVLPIVQSSATVKVAVSDLTAGRSISVSGLTNTGLTASKPVFTDASKLLTSTGVVPVANGGTNASAASITSFNNITGYTATGATGTTSTNLVFSTSPSVTTPTLVGDATLSTGNLILGTSGKGITDSTGVTTLNFTSTTITGSKLIVPSLGVKGVSTNTNATAGNVGEFISSTVAYNATGNLTTGVSTNVTSISLTAGDWDVSGTAFIDASSGSGTVVKNVLSGFSSTSATLPAYQYQGSFVFGGAGTTPFVNGDVYAPPPTFRFSLSATTTIYLVINASFTTSNCTAGGYIAARRVQPGA
jgi:hypothetical protein